jgi:hypothetical protein
MYGIIILKYMREGGRKMKKVLAAALVLMAVLSLAACGGTAQNNSQPEKATVVGTWEYELGSYIYTFNKDGTGNYDAAGTKMDFTYTDDGKTLSILFAGNTEPTELPYKIEGSKITITDSFGTDAVYNKK